MTTNRLSNIEATVNTKFPSQRRSREGDLISRKERKAGLNAFQKYELIQRVVIKHEMKGMISYLCQVVGVSHQGYHTYFSKQRIQFRQESEAKYIILCDLVLKAFHFKKRKKGARQIKIVLSDHFGVSMNLKCIRRIMRKYNIVCPIRKAKPYKRLIKAKAEHLVVLIISSANSSRRHPRKSSSMILSIYFLGTASEFIF